jgi:two-component system, response regulator
MNPKHLLLIDDSTDDLELAERLIRRAVPGVAVSCAEDGVKALKMLHAPNGERLVPDLILLDYRMPRLDGADVLKALRADEGTRNIPVVIVSSSNERGDLQRCYDLGANSYVRKPVNFANYENALRLIVQYWLGINERPD